MQMSYLQRLRLPAHPCLSQEKVGPSVCAAGTALHQIVQMKIAALAAITGALPRVVDDARL
jgi:hypothetical protein